MINFYRKKKSKEGDSKRIRTKSERLKKLKGNEIEKSYQFYKLFKIKNYNKKNRNQV
jgi:hypothetical protein